MLKATTWMWIACGFIIIAFTLPMSTPLVGNMVFDVGLVIFIGLFCYRLGRLEEKADRARQETT